MANITEFPDIMPVKQGVYADARTYTSGAPLSAGQVVKIDGTGKVVPVTATADVPLGVVLDNTAAGYPVAVQVNGLVYVANSTDSTAIAAGVFVTGGALGGVAAAATAGNRVVGVSMEPIPAAGFGCILISQGVYSVGV